MTEQPDTPPRRPRTTRADIEERDTLIAELRAENAQLTAVAAAADARPALRRVAEALVTAGLSIEEYAAIYFGATGRPSVAALTGAVIPGEPTDA